MLGLNAKLKDLHRNGNSIKVAIAGVGHMGKGLISHIRSIKGMEVVAIANRNRYTILESLKPLNISTEDSYILEEGKDLKKNVSIALENKKIILTDNLKVLTSIKEVDVVLDATGNPEAGAVISLGAINNKKHAVSLNVESDVTVGPLLKKFADNAGVVYTVAAGDEPGALKELYDFADGLGFEVIAAGKGKNNPLDREANPTTLAEYSKKKGASTKMMTSFVDGTKSMEEMACFSNATGILPDTKGMHGPNANVSQLLEKFRLKGEGGILSRTPAVDFAIGDVAPGVFLIYTARQKIIRDELKYLLFGDGPNYLLYRPYHLASIETPLSVARAYFHHEPTIAPKGAPVSEVFTVAKKDLKEGEVIDGIGGYSVYGLIEEYGKARAENLVPLGLVEGATLKADLQKGQPITYRDVKLLEDSTIFQLRKLQEKIFD
ncbi:MAG: NAD(P)H-dependent oxidoreductase [Actinomycetota bacterium]